MTSNTAQRAALSGVTMTFGLATFTVDLLPATVSRDGKSGARSFKLLCPDCREPTALKQHYDCAHHHGPFSKDDAARGIPGPGKSVRKVTEDDIKQFAIDDAETAEAVGARRADLHVYPAAQVEAATFASGTIYRLLPQTGSEESYAVMLAVLAADPSRAFLCEVTVRNVTKLYRAFPRGAVIEIVELARPSDAYPVPDVPPALFDARLLNRAIELAGALVEDFDPESFSDSRVDRMDRLREVMAVAAAQPSGPAGDAVDALLSALDASMNALEA